MTNEDMKLAALKSPEFAALLSDVQRLARAVLAGEGERQAARSVEAVARGIADYGFPFAAAPPHEGAQGREP